MNKYRVTLRRVVELIYIVDEILAKTSDEALGIAMQHVETYPDDYDKKGIDTLGYEMITLLEKDVPV